MPESEELRAWYPRSEGVHVDGTAPAPSNMPVFLADDKSSSSSSSSSASPVAVPTTPPPTRAASPWREQPDVGLVAANIAMPAVHDNGEPVSRGWFLRARSLRLRAFGVGTFDALQQAAKEWEELQGDRGSDDGEREIDR